MQLSRRMARHPVVRIGLKLVIGFGLVFGGLITALAVPMFPPPAVPSFFSMTQFTWSLSENIGFIYPVAITVYNVVQ